MRPVLLFLFTFVCLTVAVSASPGTNGDVLWFHPRMDARINALVPTADGNYIISDYPTAAWDVRTGLPRWIQNWIYGSWYADTLRRPMACTPDGKYFISPALSDSGASLVLHSAESGEVERTVPAPVGKAGISVIACSPDGNTVLCGYNNGSVAYIDINTGVLSTHGSVHSSKVTDVVFSDDGLEGCSFGGDRLLIRWRLSREGMEESTRSSVRTRDRILCSAFSPQADILAVGTGSGLLVSSPPGGADSLVAMPDAVLDIAFSDDGSMLAVAVADETVHILAAGTLLHLATLSMPDLPTSVAILHDRRTLVVGGYGSITLWDIPTATLVRTCALTPVKASFSSDGSLLAVRSSDRVDIFRTESGERLHSLATPALPASDVAFSPDGSTFAVLLRDSVRFFSLPEFTPAGAFHDNGTGWQWRWEQLMYTPDGQRLLHRATESLRVFDTGTYNLLFDIALGNNGHRGGIITPDSRSIVFTKWEGVEAHNLETRQLKWAKSLRVGHFLAVSNNGRYVAVCNNNTQPGDTVPSPQTIRILDIENGISLHAFPLADYPVNQGVPIAFAGNDRLIISVESDSIRIREIATGRQLRAFRPAFYEDLNNWYAAMSFSPDAKYLVAVERGLCVWEIGELPTTGVSASAPDHAVLSRLYPVPAHNEVVIEVHVERPCRVSVAICTTLGEQVAVVADEWMDRGVQSLQWDTQALPNGLYYCRVQTAAGSSLHKLVVLH